MKLTTLRKKQLLEVTNSLLTDYCIYLTTDEVKIINSIVNNLDRDKSLDSQEKSLLQIIKKIWNIELNSEKYIIISWNKYTDKKKNNLVTFATLSKKDNVIPFCNLKSGIEYKITYNSIIGALNRDGATLIENIKNKNEYTIGIIENKVINSYNGATKLITPNQLVNASNYNELILDTKKIVEIGEYNLNNKNEYEESIFILHKI